LAQRQTVATVWLGNKAMVRENQSAMKGKTTATATAATHYIALQEGKKRNKKPNKTLTFVRALIHYTILISFKPN
jgi:hypothetical protein